MTYNVSRFTPVFREIVDGALLIRFPGATDADANRAAVFLGERLRGSPGLHESVPGARSLLAIFDPRLTSAERISAAARTIAEGSDEGIGRLEGRLHRIPVLYGGEAGPDLPELASAAGIAAERFATLHAAHEYRVAFLGFAPGFAYMTGLLPELVSPRLATPRTRVPAGSVAIGGEYTGIYPGQTPGGWRLIGRASVRLFDTTRDPPALFAPGDRVRFEPLDWAGGPGEADHRAQTASPAPIAATSAAAILRIVTAGVWTAVVGAPRFGWARAGVAPGGAMDLVALAEGNSRLGNPAGAPALEMSFVGPELEVRSDVVAVFSGATPSAELNGRALEPDSIVTLDAGDRLRVGPLRDGARAYLCVAGGLDLPGGPSPARRLNAGDEVLAILSAPRPGERGDPRPRVREAERLVRVVLGPDEDRFGEEAIDTFLGSSFRISAASDRRGIRLEGPAVAHRGSPDVPPEGTALGAVQVARDGQPIVLGPDRPVTGGYARVANVIGADFAKIAQAVPGTPVRFQAVDVAAALEARRGLPLP